MLESQILHDLAVYRIEQAEQCYRSAVLLLEAGDYKASANRSYYCIFHSMRAVLAISGFDSKKHSGIISEFRRNYIKSGIFDMEFSDIIGSAFDVRGSSDYDDFYIASKSAVEEQLLGEKKFMNAVKAYLSV